MTTVIKTFNASATPKTFNIKKISPKPTKFISFPPQKTNHKRVSLVVAVANGDGALNASGDVTPPTKPVGDNEVVKALNSVKAVVKIVITQIVTIVTTALFKEDVTKFSKDKLKVIVKVGVWYVFGFFGKK